ncbi:flagellar filament capping protein FliD [Oceanospirillum sanctuarii]|uniref:flagellar filament capping protein FliD n=1 Tax=Oceanospirillum sanctuarii TaxID=1434821 RepID=UPI000A3767A2|nr:flagellar filament capping protein FliD [Oceanospirillum sanctuarii]
MNFLGIGSGLDLSTMLDGLVRVATEPKVNQLTRREIQIEDSISGLGILKSALSDFQSASDALKDSSLFTKMTPTLTQPASGDLIKVEAGDSAVASSYDIEVVSLAQGSKATSFWRSEKYQSDFFASTTTALSKAGDLTFTTGAATTKTITLDGSESLEAIKDKINADTDLKAAGISAKVVDGRLEYFKLGTSGTVAVEASNANVGSFATTGTNADMTLRADSTKETGLAGRLTFEADGKTFNVDIDPDETKSLDAVVAAINSADDNFGVTANIIDGKLVYQSSITGTGNNLIVTSSDGEDADGNVIGESANLSGLTTGAGNMVIGTAASDAEIKVDGVSITNDTNTFDAAVSGLTITALKQSKDAGTADAETASLTVGNSQSDVKSKIDAFASAYNKLREKMNELKGSTDEEGNFIAGKLSTDPILRNVESVLNNLITRQVDGADSELNTLYSIGLEIESDGTLATNSDRLNAALAGDMTDLQKLFAGEGAASTAGLGDEISSQLDNFVSFTGIIKGKEDSFQEQMKDIEAQYEAHARYIESYEKTLKQQFTALDATMAKMNSIMQYIGPQLAALPGAAK